MSLYRKYRPQTFADFINQKPIKEVIQNQIVQESVAHAYLFSGSRGIGKTSMARLLAKALNCEKRTPDSFEPCNDCVSCSEITAGVSLDLVEQDAASNRGIDEIRELRNTTRFAPSKSKNKIFIIDEVHMLTTPAFNALLKTLEEPPQNVVFILATTEPHKIPETIISRCQKFDFKRVHTGEIAESLRKISKAENVSVEEDILKNIALRSEGGLRDAIGMLGQIIALAEGADMIGWDKAGLVIPRSDNVRIKKLVGALENNDPQCAIGVIDEVVNDGVDLEQFTLDTISVVREKMIEALKNSDAEQATRYSKIVDTFLKRYEEVKQATFLEQLPLELAVLDCVEEEENLPRTSEVAGSKPEIVSSTKLPPAESEVNDIPLDHVKEKWNNVLNEIKGYNNSLPVALSACMPLRVEDNNKVVLGFKFKLHLNAIQDKENLAHLEHVMAEIFNEKITVLGEVSEALVFQETPKTTLDEMNKTVQEAQEVFGEAGN